MTHMRLSIQMTDKDVLDKFCRIVECGKVGPERRYGREHHKPCYVWQISNRADTERILLAFRPWLGRRRLTKAEEVLREIAKMDISCKQCGKEFRAKRLDMLFCSPECRSRWNYLFNRPAVRPSKRGRPRTI